MALRRGIYIVPTNTWYIERTVWLIAGFVLLAATALAAFMNPLFVLLVMATAFCSIGTGVTGVCAVGSTLKLLGLRGRLDRRGTTGLYLMQTDTWFLERRIYVAVGVNLTIASVLSLVHTPLWLLFTAFVGGAMVWFAATGFCIMANGLYWLGAEPRLAPEVRRAQCGSLGAPVADG